MEEKVKDVMKPLGQEYRANGSMFKVLKRVGDVVIACEHNERYPLFEVFIVQQQQAGYIFDNPVEAKERVPSNSEFGSLGWQWPSAHERLAWAKFKKEVRKRNNTAKSVEAIA